MDVKKEEVATPGRINDLNKLTVTQSKYTTFSDRSAIQHLRELHIADSKRKHPSLLYHTAPLFAATKTNGLTKCVLHFLQLKGWHCERTGNEGRLLDTRQTFKDTVGLTRTVGSVQRIKSSGMSGTSDLKAIINGRFVAIEIKNAATHDRQSEAQREYQAEVEKSGGVYVIVTSFAQFLNWYYSKFNNHE